MAGEIFISYRRSDEAWARLLHTELQSHGIEAWYDGLIGAGQDWRSDVAEALESSSIVVLLFSASAARSSEIAKELAAATLENKLIIPVRLENVAPKGAFLYELASRNWVNAYDDTEAKLAELAKGLAHLVRTGVRDQSLLPFDRADGRRPRRARGRIYAATAALMIIAIAALGAWWFWPAPRWIVENSRPFISTLALEDDPIFSPNGELLAYTSAPEGSHRQIYIRSLKAGEGLRLTSDSYDDISPSWSSDGARLAYIAIKPGEACRIMVSSVPAGDVREAGRCRTAPSSLLTWQAGTPFVYAIEHGGLKGDAIFRLNLDSGARQDIVAMPAVRDIITGLRCSPDGKSLAYLLRGEQIMVRDLVSGHEKQLGTIVQGGYSRAFLAWTEDSATVLAGITGDVGGSEIIAYPLTGTSPYTVYTTPIKTGNFATGGGLLALETDISRSSLARASTSPSKQPDVIDPANGLTWSPSFAPDGTLAFISDRSGTNAIWLMKPGRAPSMLFDVGLSRIDRVRFSPDGTRLAVVSETPRDVTVKIITSGGAGLLAFQMPSLGLGLPTWTPDGRAVLVFDRHSLRTVLVPIDNIARRTPFAAPHWVGIAMRKNGTFATRVDKPGIWRIDGVLRQINSVYPAYYQPPLAFRGDDVLVPDFTSASQPRIFAQPVSGGPSRILAYAPGATDRRGQFQSDFAVNPVTGEIIYTAQVSRDTNIDLLTLRKR